MEKRDYRKELKHLNTAPKGKPALLEVPPLNFLMIDGEGDPNQSAAFQQAVQALYQLSYTLKFMVKKELEIDYSVMALEGLWWADDPVVFAAGDKSSWQWTLMIMQPEPVTADLVHAARDAAQSKKGASQALEQLRFERFEEGLCAQVLHVGPYDAEAPAIAALHAFIHEQGCVLRGKHHEIYLGDPGRAAPEKLKTILRQPCVR